MDCSDLPPLPIPVDLWNRLAAELEFSPKQKKVVELILRNRCDKQIEAKLNMPHSTLRTHIKRIFHRAHIADRQELILLLLAKSHEIRRPCG